MFRRRRGKSSRRDDPIAALLRSDDLAEVRMGRPQGRTRISNSPRMPSYLPLPPIQRPAAIWTGARGWELEVELLPDLISVRVGIGAVAVFLENPGFCVDLPRAEAVPGKLVQEPLARGIARRQHALVEALLPVGPDGDRRLAVNHRRGEVDGERPLIPDTAD